MTSPASQSATSTATSAADFLIASGISKRFAVTQALDNVSVSFRAGEVHALMGENGAGKSTLGKVISGLHKQDSGTVTIAGHTLNPGSLDDAFRAGIRIVHQELAQCPNLTVAENLSLHHIPRNGLGLVDYSAMNERAARLVHTLDDGIDVRAELGTLTAGRRQIVQIASSLDAAVPAGASPPRVIVFDEPTSSLSLHETSRLLQIIRKLAADGLTCIYVSHRMSEIFEVCDRVSVLRDGKFVATNVIKEINEPILVEQMIGRRIEAVAKRTPPPAAPVPALRVANLVSAGKLNSVGFEVHPGEILGVGGLVGSGRSELLDAVFGLDPSANGEIIVNGQRLASLGPRAAMATGMGYVPEDRRLQGLFFDLGIDENIVLPFMRRLAAGIGLRRFGSERALVGGKMTEFRVKAASPASRPGELSGGNQQKLLLARWMGRDTKVLLLDEPTRGIDIGTKTEVYKLIRAAADAGVAVVVVSSEMPELLSLSDRLIVMNQGTVAGELRGDDMTQTNILRLATQGH
ncbi:MAG: sugar ABC transporter ATP-binding protein [Planctomycetes bacterium]|nr:sugar ABC transporter ATP-binding protein [Planctomycetota bacterium]